MENKFSEYEKTIKKEHRFSWTPKFQSEFPTTISSKEFISLTEKTLQELGWDLIYFDENNVEAKRKETDFGGERWTEAISITFEYGKISVTSTSLGNEFWDRGNNSKRVKLFIYAFQDVLKSLSKEELQNLVKETEDKLNWEEYTIPEILPAPSAPMAPKFYLVVLGGLIISGLISFLLAKLWLQKIYIIGLFDILAGLTIGYSFKYLIQFSNFTDWIKWRLTLITVIAIIFVFTQYLQYVWIVQGSAFDKIGFFEFMKMRIEQGLLIKKMNLGGVGLIVSWILQLFLTYAVANMLLIKYLTQYQINRIPEEVTDFAFYHLVKGKSEDQIRMELASKGWTNGQNQDEVMEAIGAIQSNQEMNRIK